MLLIFESTFRHAALILVFLLVVIQFDVSESCGGKTMKGGKMKGGKFMKGGGKKKFGNVKMVKSVASPYEGDDYQRVSKRQLAKETLKAMAVPLVAGASSELIRSASERLHRGEPRAQNAHYEGNSSTRIVEVPVYYAINGPQVDAHDYDRRLSNTRHSSTQANYSQLHVSPPPSYHTGPNLHSYAPPQPPPPSSAGNGHYYQTEPYSAPRLYRVHQSDGAYGYDPQHYPRFERRVYRRQEEEEHWIQGTGY